METSWQHCLYDGLAADKTQEHPVAGTFGSDSTQFGKVVARESDSRAKLPTARARTNVVPAAATRRFEHHSIY